VLYDGLLLAENQNIFDITVFGFFGGWFWLFFGVVFFMGRDKHP
jgi:succinate-acetate transporter protein